MSRLILVRDTTTTVEGGRWRGGESAGVALECWSRALLSASPHSTPPQGCTSSALAGIALLRALVGPSFVLFGPAAALHCFTMAQALAPLVSPSNCSLSSLTSSLLRSPLSSFTDLPLSPLLSPPPSPSLSLSQAIIGAAMMGFHFLNAPVNKRELIDTHSKGFDTFHRERGLSTPQTIVDPPSTTSPVYLHDLRISPSGEFTHPLRPMHTTWDGVVERRRNEHFERKAETLNLFNREGWKEDAGQWSAAYRRMLVEKYGVRGYKVKVKKTKVEGWEEGDEEGEGEGKEEGENGEEASDE
jgi:hypothetical protein